jgi:hypothetical protein
MKSRWHQIFAFLAAVACASCSSFPTSRSTEFAVASSSPRLAQPHAILAAKSGTVSRGEVIALRLTLINPTEHPIALPDANSGKITGMLSAQWAMDGIQEGHYTGADISSFTTNTSATARRQLGAGEMIDYSIRWKSSFPEEGHIDLEFDFEFYGNQSCKLRLRSQPRPNKARLGNPH